MLNWKDNLKSYGRTNGCVFAMSVDQVERWAEPIVVGLVKEVKKERDNTKVEVEKNKELLRIIEEQATMIAELKIKNANNQLRLPLEVTF